MKEWNFIANHGLVLLYVSQNRESTMREIAAAIGVTERSIQRILKDLETEEYVTWQTTGKGNVYEINRSRELKHEITRDLLVGDLLKLLNNARRQKR